MALYDDKGNWSSEALNICDEINKVLNPILEKTLAEGMSHSDFCYMVHSEVELLILEDRRFKRAKDNNI